MGSFPRHRAIRALAGALGFCAAAAGCDVSQEQEVELGRSNAEQINAQIPLVRDPAVVDYVTAMGQDLARRTQRGDLDWRFFVVDAHEVNAFALPGGFIYVNRGLIERTQRLDQLAGVLGHEIGHVTQRHSVDQLKKQTGANVGVVLFCTLTGWCDNAAAQIAISVGGSAVFAKHSREDEAEADSVAIDIVRAAGVDPRGIPSMFEILQAERRGEPGALEAFFASHPLEGARVDRTRALIEQLPAGELEGLVSDQPSYAQFLARVRSLPPPPAPRQLAPPR